MPSAGRDDLPEIELAPGYRSRCAEWGDLTVAFERASAGDDVATALAALPDGRCQARHWGYLFSGRIVVSYADREEAIVGGQAYHVEPGHTLRFEEDCEAVEFTPTGELQQTLQAMHAAG